MKTYKMAPGPCPACGDRLAPAELLVPFRTSDPILPHFQCTGCRTVFSMDPVNFELTECECPREHVELSAPARNLEADAAEVRNRYFPLSRSPRSKVPA